MVSCNIEGRQVWVSGNIGVGMYRGNGNIGWGD